MHRHSAPTPRVHTRACRVRPERLVTLGRRAGCARAWRCCAAVSAASKSARPSTSVRSSLPSCRGARRVSPPLSMARAALPAAAGRAHEPRPATPGCLRLEGAQAPSSPPQRGQVSGALIRTVAVPEFSQSGEHLKRAARELAGLSQAHARQRCERMQHAAHDRGAAVHVQLRHILSCRQRTSSQLGRLSLPCTPLPSLQGHRLHARGPDTSPRPLGAAWQSTKEARRAR